jgi:serine-type D-Ala-D-Ala carboxypeptidase/endopeptidase (penicillin-binding protein 4)
MMKKVALFIALFSAWSQLPAQTVQERLRISFQRFMADSQLKHAAVSLYVIDAKTGQPVFDFNSQLGLAPASTQKIITSVTAFELLGRDYRYKTTFGLITEHGFTQTICIRPSGDPTLGSNRYAGTKAAAIFENCYSRLVQHGYRAGGISFLIDSSGFETNTIPDGWIWQDLGNYYGAGSGVVNWRENQFDVSLKSGDVTGMKTELISFNNSREFLTPFVNEVKTAAKGSGDNAYIYLPLSNGDYRIRGTIPAGEPDFTISGAVYNGAEYMMSDFGKLIAGKNNNKLSSRTMYVYGKTPDTVRNVYTHYSPSLDSIIYWFNKKSINLYGEALVKTIAREKQGYASTDSGVAYVRSFWKDKGLDPEELNMYDGSGLSPLNRVTTHAQVEILKYAKNKNWFPAFYDALPEFNGMKMKSGTISDVKGYCGYHKAKDGREYIFSFLINNYSGKTGPVVSKMFKVLDELK